MRNPPPWPPSEARRGGGPVVAWASRHKAWTAAIILTGLVTISAFGDGGGYPGTTSTILGTTVGGPVPTVTVTATPRVVRVPVPGPTVTVRQTVTARPAAVEPRGSRSATRPADTPGVGRSGARGKGADRATARCRDGTYSYVRHRAAACGQRGGAKTWLGGR